MFAFRKQRRRRQIVEQPFPPLWEEYLHANVWHYRFLSETERSKLRDDLRILIAEKSWEGCGGLGLTDEMRVTIAGQACLLTLCLENDYYPNVESILVYPAGYRVRERRFRAGGVVEVRKEHRLGEAHHLRGPVILSWEDALHAGRNPANGSNLVLHEFAHKLDTRDGDAHGTPRLATEADYDEWFQVMTEAFDRLREKLGRGEPTVLDDYGATDAAEFFAVATECFFEQPRELQAEYPRLYELLCQYYRQDTAARVVE